MTFMHEKRFGMYVRTFLGIVHLCPQVSILRLSFTCFQWTRKSGGETSHSQYWNVECPRGGRQGQMQMTQESTTAAGFTTYEVSNHARQGRECIPFTHQTVSEEVTPDGWDRPRCGPTLRDFFILETASWRVTPAGRLVFIVRHRHLLRIP